jgi:hypothetical protein
MHKEDKHGAQIHTVSSDSATLRGFFFRRFFHSRRYRFLCNYCVSTATLSWVSLVTNNDGDQQKKLQLP